MNFYVPLAYKKISLCDGQSSMRRQGDEDVDIGLICSYFLGGSGKKILVFAAYA